MKKVILIIIMVLILFITLFTLTGCKITAETYDNGVSVEVDDATKGTFENILDWITERIDRVFNV